MQYLNETGLRAFWKNIKDWVRSKHGQSIAKGTATEAGIPLNLMNGADTPAALGDTVTITKSDITALGIPGSQPTVPGWVANPKGSDITLDAGIAGVTDGSTVSEGMNEHGESIAANAAAIAKKQDNISDLATIRAGAAKGATALQSVPSTYRTAAQQDAIHDSTKADKASPTFTGTPKAPTAAAGTNTTQVATCAFVQSAVAAASTGAAKYQGGMTPASYKALTTYKQGWYWVVTEAGTIAGESCEIGDMVFCNTDNAAAGTKKDAHFDIVQNNIDAIPLSVINALS